MAFYAVMKHDTREDTIHVFKCATASDPNTITNWTSQATYVLDGDVKSIWVVEDSSDLHIAVAGVRQRNQDHTGFVKYLRYDVGTDAIDIDEEQADDDDSAINANQSVCSIAVRSDGDVIICYTQRPNPTSWTNRYSRREPSWTRSVAISSLAQGSPVAILGASDLIHFFSIVYTANGDVNHRSLNSSNTLGTETSLDTDIGALSGAETHRIIGAVTFNDGTARVRVAYEDLNGQISTAYGNDTANPTFTAEVDASDNDVVRPGTQSIGDLVLDGQVSHLIYSEAVSSDIFIDENDGIGGWGTDTEEQDAVTCNALSANVYNRSGQKLAYLWDDAGTTKYDEVDIAGVAAEKVPLNRRLRHRAARATRGNFAA